MTAEPLLQLDAQWIRRGNKIIIGPVSLALAHGETVAITGPSGIGKTSLLRVLAGLDQDFCGEYKAPDIAMMFQEPALLPWRNLVDNLCLATGIAPVSAKAALAEVGLAGLETRFPGQLSLGQRRRTAFARALAAKAPLLLLDEPFASLDPPRCEQMMTLLEQCQRSILLVTHEMEHASRLASRILRLDEQPARLITVG